MPLIPFTLTETPLVGLEDLQRAAFWVFFEGMNNALQEISDYWAPRDLVYDQRVGTTLAPTVLEAIPTNNFHTGHKPSLVNGSPDNYPNLCVFAMQATPAAESNNYDQIDAWLDSLLVEVMVKGPDEDVTNRRIQRTVEAAVMCIRRNPTLGGSTYGLANAPSIVISDLFAVSSSSQGGAYQYQPNPMGMVDGGRYVWQGAQIQFRIQKDSSPPSSGPGTFAEASQIDYSQYIDQG
jgi:hypothetical protein